MKRLKAFLPLLLLLAIGVALYFSHVLDFLAPEQLVARQEKLQAMIAGAPLTARLVAIGLMVLGVATGLPGTILLVLGCGFLFGVVEGTLLTAIGLLIGSLVLFLASRHAFGSGLRAAPALVERVRSGYQRHPPSYTFFLRLVPLFPFGAVTIALAWLRCPLWLFVLASVVGGSINLVFETAIGAGLAEYLAEGRPLGFGLLLEPRFALPLLALALLALVPVLLNWHAGRRRLRNNPQNRA